MSEKPTVKIKITGGVGAGKTALMHIIGWTLKKHGIKVEGFDDIGGGRKGSKITEFAKPVKREYCQNRLVRITAKSKYQI